MRVPETSRVSEEIERAGFFKFFDDNCGGDRTLGTERYSLGDEIDRDRELRKRKIADVLSDDFPALVPIFVRYKRIIERDLNRLRGMLANIQKVSENLPEGKNLRPRQIHFLQEIARFFGDPKHSRRTGYVKYPSGMGKTILMGIIVRWLIMAGGEDKTRRPKILILSPRRVINAQNREKIREWQEHGVTVKNMSRIREDEEVDVTISTYADAAQEVGARADQPNKYGSYDVIFLDECHAAFGPMMLKFLREKQPNAIIIGFSATPYIGSTQNPKSWKSGLHYFEGEIDSFTLKDACENEDLAPIRGNVIRVKSEKYDENDTTDERLIAKSDFEKRTKIAVQIGKKIPKNERGIVYCSRVEHAQAVAEEMCKNGIKAAAVWGEMPQSGPKGRDQIIDDFKEGKYQFLVNADLLTQGYDDEPLEHVIMLRPTMSLWLYEQIIGRIARLDPKDPHKIATVWDIVGQNSKQCTLFGLARLYGDKSRAFANGQLVFAPTEMREKHNRALAEELDSKKISASEIAEVRIPMDIEYFTNPENVRHDIEAFKKASRIKNIKKMRINDFYDKEVRCSNGEKCKGSLYLKRAAYALDLAENIDDYRVNIAVVYNELLKIAGFDHHVYTGEAEEDEDGKAPPEIRPMDLRYWTSRQNIKTDIEAFASKLKLLSIDALRPEHMEIAVAVCRNNESVRGTEYLRRAAVAFAQIENSKNPFTLRLVLAKLKRIAKGKEKPPTIV